MYNRTKIKRNTHTKSQDKEWTIPFQKPAIYITYLANIDRDVCMGTLLDGKKLTANWPDMAPSILNKLLLIINASYGSPCDADLDFVLTQWVVDDSQLWWYWIIPLDFSVAVDDIRPNKLPGPTSSLPVSAAKNSCIAKKVFVEMFKWIMGCEGRSLYLFSKIKGRSF